MNPITKFTRKQTALDRGSSYGQDPYTYKLEVDGKLVGEWPRHVTHAQADEHNASSPVYMMGGGIKVSWFNS